MIKLTSKTSTTFLTLGCFSLILGCFAFVYLIFTKSFGAAFLYGIIAVIALLLLAGVSAHIETKNKEKHRNKLFSMQPPNKDFHDSYTYVSDDLLTKVTIDNVNDLLFIWEPQDRNIKTIQDIKPHTHYQVHTYSHTDVLAIKHQEDDACLTRKMRNSPSAQFWLEDIVSFSDDETHKATNQSEVNSIALTIIIRDKANPIYSIYFYKNPSNSLQKNTEAYKQIQLDIQQCLTAFHFMMKEADQQEYVNLQNSNENKNEFITLNNSFNKSQRQNQKEVIRLKLLPLLRRVILQKIEANSTMNEPQTLENQQRENSYFNELLKRNRESLYGKEK